MAEISDEDLAAWLRIKAAAGTAPPVDDSLGARAGRFGMGVVRGARDVVDAGAQLITRTGEMLPGAAGEFMTGQSQDVERINRGAEQDYQKNWRGGADGIDWGRMVGNIAATMPIAAAIPGGAAATMGGRIGYGAATGGAANALQPVQIPERTTADLIAGKPPDDNFWTEKAKQIGIGAATGGALSGAATAAGRMLSPATTPEARALINEGVRVLPGQRAGGWRARMEDKASSVIPAIADRQRDAIDDFVVATGNKALAPIKGKIPAGTSSGREVMAEVHRQIGDAYDNLLPGMVFQADRPLVANLANLRSLAQNMPPERAKQFDNILTSQFLGKLNPNTGVMAGETFNRAQSEIGRVARSYMHSASADERELGRALSQAHSELLDGIMRTNPAQAKQFAAVRSAAADAMRMDHAAASLGAPNGAFTGAQLTNAVKRMDPSTRKNAFAEGSARGQPWAEGAKNVLGSKYPDSGTAGRMLQGGAMLGYFSPEALASALAGMTAYSRTGMKALDAALYGGGRYRQMLVDALTRGAPLAAPAASANLQGVP